MDMNGWGVILIHGRFHGTASVRLSLHPDVKIFKLGLCGSPPGNSTQMIVGAGGCGGEAGVSENLTTPPSRPESLHFGANNPPCKQRRMGSQG